MTDNYTQKVNVESNPTNAFLALTKEVEKWWGHVDTSADTLDDVFTITFGRAYWTFKVVELERDRLVTWQCIDGQPELNNEWIGHRLTWSIIPGSSQIEIQFDQEGLTEALPCFDVCSAAWDRFILSSLKAYLETGLGQPG